MTAEIYIKKAIYLEDFVILLVTTDGDLRIMDFKPMLDGDLGAFESLKQEDVFKKFYLDTNILTWDIDLPKKSENQINQYDVAPEYVYEQSTLLLHNEELRELVQS